MSHVAPSSTQTKLKVRGVSAILKRYRYLFGDEVALQDAIAGVLEHHVEFEREKILDAKNRADFWLPDDGIAIEVKVDGSLAEALRQVDRYCHLEQVRGVILASSKLWASQPLKTPPTLGGKVFEMAHLRRQSL